MKIQKPDDAEAGTFEDQLLLRLRSDWAVGRNDLSERGRCWQSISTTGSRAKATGLPYSSRARAPAWRRMSDTKHFLLLNELDNVRKPALCRSNTKMANGSAAP